MFKIICNIPGIPDYTTWSAKSNDAQPLSQTSGYLREIKIETRTNAIAVLNQRLPLREIDGMPDSLDFERWHITDSSVVDRISEFLRFQKPSGRVQVLGPGATVPLHLDDLRRGYFDGSEPSYQKNEFTDRELEEFQRNPQCAQRVLIMLEDHHPGQCIIFGDQVCNSWKKGDVIHWDWINVEHATVNAGYWRRPLLRLSGLVDQNWPAEVI